MHHTFKLHSSHNACLKITCTWLLNFHSLALHDIKLTLRLTATGNLRQMKITHDITNTWNSGKKSEFWFPSYLELMSPLKKDSDFSVFLYSKWECSTTMPYCRWQKWVIHLLKHEKNYTAKNIGNTVMVCILLMRMIYGETGVKKSWRCVITFTKTNPLYCKTYRYSWPDQWCKDSIQRCKDSGMTHPTNLKTLHKLSLQPASTVMLISINMTSRSYSKEEILIDSTVFLLSLKLNHRENH